MKISNLAISAVLIASIGSISMKSAPKEVVTDNIYVEALASPCPGPYDVYHQMLDQVNCIGLDGKPTGQTYMDCVSQVYVCCNSSHQTPCNEPDK
jgi:hypothetical protein